VSVHIFGKDGFGVEHIIFAIQAFGAVLAQLSVLLHHHVHGPVPLTGVGVPVKQVGVGVVAELIGALQAPFTRQTPRLQACIHQT
jgi:hypothetical protein